MASSYPPYAKGQLLAEVRVLILCQAQRLLQTRSRVAATAFAGFGADDYTRAEPTDIDPLAFAVGQELGLAYDYAFQVGAPRYLDAAFFADLDETAEWARDLSSSPEALGTAPVATWFIEATVAAANARRWLGDDTDAEWLPRHAIALLAGVMPASGTYELSTGRDRAGSDRMFLPRAAAREWLGGQPTYLPSRL